MYVYCIYICIYPQNEGPKYHASLRVIALTFGSTDMAATPTKSYSFRNSSILQNRRGLSFPKGPGTHILRTLGFYMGNHVCGLGP